MRGTPIMFSSFQGGVNTEDSVYEIAQNEARDARNVVATPRGAIKKRDGCRVHATMTVNLHSLFSMRNPDYLLGAGGTSWYRIDTAGAVTAFAAGR